MWRPIDFKVQQLPASNSARQPTCTQFVLCVSCTYRWSSDRPSSIPNRSPLMDSRTSLNGDVCQIGVRYNVCGSAFCPRNTVFVLLSSVLSVLKPKLQLKDSTHCTPLYPMSWLSCLSPVSSLPSINTPVPAVLSVPSVLTSPAPPLVHQAPPPLVHFV
jgi:hypothetical protein